MTSTFSIGDRETAPITLSALEFDVLWEHLRLGTRAERVVSFFDTEAGRYLQVRRPAPDGVLWTTISPADVRKLTHHVTELLDEIVTEVEGAR